MQNRLKIRLTRRPSCCMRPLRAIAVSAQEEDTQFVEQSKQRRKRQAKQAAQVSGSFGLRQERHSLQS